MRILGTNSTEVSYPLDAELVYHLELNDAEQTTYTGHSMRSVRDCIQFEYAKPGATATGGVLHIRLDAKFAFLKVDFVIEE